MSDEATRFKKSKRLLKTKNNILKQRDIAKVSGLTNYQTDQLGRYAKHHALDCGIPNCWCCDNPRAVWGKQTFKEDLAEQNFKIDSQNDWKLQ